MTHRKLAALTTTVVLAISSFANAAKLSTPTNREIDLSPIAAVLKTQPKDLVKFIEASGVKVLIIQSESKSVNPLWTSVPKVSAQTLAKWKLDGDNIGSSEGLFVSDSSSCCDKSGNLILIGDEAVPMTLIHEFMHAVMYSQLSKEKKIDTSSVVDNATNARATLKFRFEKVFKNRANLSNELWRRDMLNALNDYVDAMDKVIYYNISEEVIIERTLEKMIDKNSPYFNQVRLDQGDQYAKNKAEQIRILLKDADFVSAWMVGELKTLEDSIPMEEQYKSEESYKALHTKITQLAETYAKLNAFTL